MRRSSSASCTRHPKYLLMFVSTIIVYQTCMVYCLRVFIVDELLYQGTKFTFPDLFSKLLMRVLIQVPYQLQQLR